MVLALLAVLVAGPREGRAQIGSDRYSSIVVDAANGNVLSAVSADELRFPASLTKMMTLYMVFEALRDRRLSLSAPVPVSAHAASMSPSKLGLVPSTKLTVEQAILGLVTKSANDAAAALGELLGGDEERFGQMMTLRARALGMSHTQFRNASGLPDPEQVTTARDLATLARHLIQDFPAEYRYFSTPSFVFRGRTILNHDHMLQTYPGADGLKTGYIVASGFNLVTSAVHGNVRLIGVVLGAAGPGERDQHMAALLDAGFQQMGVAAAPRREVASSGGIISSAQAAQGDAAPARPAPSQRVANNARWSVQTAVFGTQSAARNAAELARRAADDGDVRIEPAGTKARPAYRGVVGGLSQSDARAACAALAQKHMGCTLLRPEGGQVASR
jgi:D-alanyl-D-alanine carboxypeptidase